VLVTRLQDQMLDQQAAVVEHAVDDPALGLQRRLWERNGKHVTSAAAFD
jgi:hypothetical protein